MTEAKIELRVGEIEFCGQGDQEWVAKQLDKILTKAGDLVKLAPSRPKPEKQGQHRPPADADPSIANMTLAAFLQEKRTKSNQMRKFLATAVWLQAKGANRLTAADVSKALGSANQVKLGNPSQCLLLNAELALQAPKFPIHRRNGSIAADSGGVV